MADIDRLQCRNIPMNFLPPTPPGLEALYLACRRIYLDQPNPLQVAALVKYWYLNPGSVQEASQMPSKKAVWCVKRHLRCLLMFLAKSTIYWLGGPDPLDYISMYANPGDVELDVPPHWHYISFGLSDLHGDGRVHEVTGPETPSGFGFELTFRLRREASETAPPTWPATLMQSLAKYVFQSGNTLCAGDHVSWHCALDNSESRIQHILMAADAQLTTTTTPFGPVSFVQVVGICKEELLAAQRWNGPGVLDILKRLPVAGGAWLVTDMRRGENILELDPAAQEEVDRGIEEDGSNLSGVSARCSWSEFNQLFTPGENGGLATPPLSPHSDSEQIQAALKKGSLNTRPVLPPIKGQAERHGIDSKDNNLESHFYDEDCLSEATELVRTRRLESLHLTFNLESGILLPLAIRGRVRHGRHFTFKSVLGDTAITLVAASVTGTFVDADKPYVAHGPWLQVLIPEDFIETMATSLEPLNNPDQLTLPKTFFWKERKLAITILSDGRYQ